MIHQLRFSRNVKSFRWRRQQLKFTKNIKTKKWYKSGNSANSPAIISAHLKCLCWIHKFVKECGECLDISLTTRRPSTYDSLKFLQCSFLSRIISSDSYNCLWIYSYYNIASRHIHCDDRYIYLSPKEKKILHVLCVLANISLWTMTGTQFSKKICWTFAKLGRRWVSPTGHSFRGKHPSTEEEWSIRS